MSDGAKSATIPIASAIEMAPRQRVSSSERAARADIARGDIEAAVLVLQESTRSVHVRWEVARHPEFVASVDSRFDSVFDRLDKNERANKVLFLVILVQLLGFILLTMDFYSFYHYHP